MFAVIEGGQPTRIPAGTSRLSATDLGGGAIVACAVFGTLLLAVAWLAHTRARRILLPAAFALVVVAVMSSVVVTIGAPARARAEAGFSRPERQLGAIAPAFFGEALMLGGILSAWNASRFATGIRLPEGPPAQSAESEGPFEPKPFDA
ncbi:MAG: hypothetical protein ABR548_05065 [Actinomycetota bacterium]